MYPSRLAFLWLVSAWQSPAHSAWKQGNRGGSARRVDWAKQSEWMQRTESVQCGLRQNLSWVAEYRQRAAAASARHTYSNALRSW
jgi:hypothetical protein